MKRLAFCLALGLAAWATSSLQAQTVLYIGDTNAAFTSYLGGFGTVTSTTTGNTVNVTDISTTANAWSEGIGGPGFTVKQALETFDLVVLGRSAGSGTLNNATIRTNWANLNAPILSISPYQTRNDRLGWFSHTGAFDTTLGGSAGDDVNVATNPLGLTVGAADWYVHTTTIQSPSGSGSAGDGITLASFNSNNTGGTRNGLPAAFLWEVGDQFGGLASGIPAPARRAFFALNQNATDLSMLTVDGQSALTATIDWVMIPEPSTWALLIVGGGLLAGVGLRRKRQA